MKNKINKLIFITIVLLFSTKECFAASGININYASVGSKNNVYDKDGDGIPTYNNTWKDGNADISCKVDYEIEVTGGDTVYGYNQQNQEMMITAGDRTQTSEDIVAGTAVGLQIVESKTIKWEIKKVKVTKTVTKPTKTTCTRQVLCNVTMNFIGWFKIPFLRIPNDRWCTESCSYEDNGKNGCTCTTTGGGKDVTDIKSGEQYDKCKEAAIKEQIQPHANSYKGSNYVLKLRDSNDINNSNPIKEISGSGGCSGDNPIYCKYTYGPKTVCLNVKTAKVSYPSSNNCQSGEIKIEDDSNHWHYFIPLNTKEKDDFVLTMTYSSQSQEQSGDFCVKVIENNPRTYQSFVRDKNNEKLPSNITRAKEIALRGCYFGNEIKITTEQKFYNEQEDGTFKGFNFYYKPINVNNPFPNGIPDNSIWTQKDVDKLTGTSLKKENVTYVANVTNPNAIREYKDEMITHGEYLYTRWDNMYLSGVSNFVEKSGFVKPIEEKRKIYKLGCGSANENETHSDGTKNYMYQGWCKSQ